MSVDADGAPASMPSEPSRRFFLHNARCCATSERMSQRAPRPPKLRGMSEPDYSVDKGRFFAASDRTECRSRDSDHECSWWCCREQATITNREWHELLLARQALSDAPGAKVSQEIVEVVETWLSRDDDYDPKAKRELKRLNATLTLLESSSSTASARHVLISWRMRLDRVLRVKEIASIPSKGGAPSRTYRRALVEYSSEARS
jgi:hypothetical protein